MKAASSSFQSSVVLAAWLLLSPAAASAAPAQPVTDSGIETAFDFDGDGTTDATYERHGVNIRPGGEPYYRVSFSAKNTAQLRFVRGSAQRIDLTPRQTVSVSNPVHVNVGEGNSVGLLAYDAEWMLQSFWRFYPPNAFVQDLFFTNKTEVLVGFRLTSLEAGTKHHGWIRFTRPDSHFTTPFAVAGYDWNPLPNEPIGAGQPPVIPVQSAFTDEGQLRLQWPAEVANWVLESSPTLGPDAVWEPVPDVVGTEHLIEAPEADRFYRLRRP